MIDFRTDVLTPPTDEMWAAMRRTEPGWNDAGADNTVAELEALGASLLGKESALFTPTCTMANLLSLMTQGRRGTQVILEADSHIAWSEESGLSYICGLFPRLLPGQPGVPQLPDIEAAITLPQFGHLPQTSVLCLENSHNNAGGIAVTVEQTRAIADLAHHHHVAVHVDGARLFNAAAALAVSAAELAAPVDTVAISLNKGLRAPYGALLCGPRAVIEEARINLKRLGAGSIHKSGIFAAAGIVALTTMTDQVAHDNRRAHELAQMLALIPGLYIALPTVQTNIINVVVTREAWTARQFADRLASHGVLALARTPIMVRFVTHSGIGDADIIQAAEIIKAVMHETDD